MWSSWTIRWATLNGWWYGQADDARAELDRVADLGDGGEQHLRRGDRLPARRVVLADPELVEAEAVEVGAERDVALEHQRRRLAGRVVRREERSEAHPGHRRTATRTTGRRRSVDGGDEGTRTLNPRLAKAVRYQLRHVPGAATRYRRESALAAVPLRRAGTGGGQSSLRATAFGVTFIFGSYSATSTMRASRTNAARRSSRHDAHGP